MAVVEDGDIFRVTLDLRNTGVRAGKAVPQVYVGYAGEVGEPPQQLKGFDAVRLDVRRVARGRPW